MSKTMVLLMTVGFAVSLAVRSAYPFPSDDEWAWPSIQGADSAPTPAFDQTHIQADNVRTDGHKMVPAIVGAPPTPRTTDYRLNPQDLVNVTVFQVPELSTTQNIGNTGHIQLPLIGHIAIGGLTMKEAEQRITDRLSRDYLQNPRVNVFVKEYKGLKFTMLGAIRKPGVFDITGPTTLLQGLAMAGGFTHFAKESKIMLLRTENAGYTQAYIIDGKKLQSGALADPILIGGDRIVIPESEIQFIVKDVLGTLRAFIPFVP
ncbi:MAG: polysaccharide export protein [Gammaproteobacteria bacterium]|nr:polysaccharide export protein [Gammaproteobacteria bacterium]